MAELAETVRDESSFTSPLAPGVTLHRISIRPADPGAIRARLVIVHGYGDHAGRYADFMSSLAARAGVACHALDLRGHGRSSGPRVFVRRWDEYLDDLRAMLAQPAVSSGAPAPLFLLSQSHGGLVITVAVERGLVDVAGCILCAPFFVNCLPIPPLKRAAAAALNVVWPSYRVPSGVKPRMTSRDPAMIEASRGDPLLVRRATPRWYFEHLKAQAEAVSNASRFTAPLLILQGDADPIADPRGATAFHANAGSTDKTLIAYPGFLHEPLREVGRERVYDDVLAWIDARTR